MSDIYTNPAGNLILEVKDDKLSAWLTIRKTGKLTDEKEILDLLDMSGIKAGFEEAMRYNREHSIEKDFEETFPIAMCEIIQEDMPLSHHFNTEQARKMVQDVVPDDLGELLYVPAGMIIAEYSSNIFNRRGSIFNVFGEMVQTQTDDIEARQALAGADIAYDQHLGKYTALRGGYVAMDDSGKMSIIDTLVIQGDVDKYSGEIATPANLIIEGSVTGCKFAIRGNLLIRGNIVDSTVFCEGNLTIEGNIRSCQLPGIQVLGDINCQGVIQSYVLCRGKMCSEHTLEDSFVVGEKGVEGSRMLGGTIQTSGNILLDSIGEPDGPEASIEVTISPFYKALLMQLAKDMVHARQTDDPDKVAEVQDRSKQCEQELDKQLNEFLHRPDGVRCKVSVNGEVYPLLYLRVLKHDYTFKTRQSSLEIIERD